MHTVCPGVGPLNGYVLLPADDVGWWSSQRALKGTCYCNERRSRTLRRLCFIYGNSNSRKRNRLIGVNADVRMFAFLLFQEMRFMMAGVVFIVVIDGAMAGIDFVANGMQRRIMVFMNVLLVQLRAEAADAVYHQQNSPYNRPKSVPALAGT